MPINFPTAAGREMNLDNKGNTLQRVLNGLHEWSVKRQWKFNTDKCEVRDSIN